MVTRLINNAWLSNAFRSVECSYDSSGYLLTVSGAGVFSISADGAWIEQLQAESGAGPGVSAEILLGPCLILSLAIRGTWTFHCSAIMIGGKAAIFLGESGWGKSTLARYLDRGTGGAMQRISDDILPVIPFTGGLNALPHYPQLKLPWEAQPCHYAPKQLPIAVFYQISGQDEAGEEVTIQRLSPYQGSLALVRHTVASRLFAPDLLGKHLQFCTSTAQQIPVRRLSYPHRYELLPVIREKLAADLVELDQ